jgi:phosphatidylserine decarboxylase
MTVRVALMKILQWDELNFILTNRIPRRLSTTFLGWFSKIENPLVCAVSIFVWRLVTDLDLSDAQLSHFSSMHACFTRRLKDGARPIDANPQILASPCDSIIGAMGTVGGTTVFQIKDMPYSTAELFGDDAHAEIFRGGQYITLRLTSAMYHRFHAPHDCHAASVTHFFGDVWNVNPATLERVPKLFVKNERALVRTTLTTTGHEITLVTVAAILVAGIRLNFVDLRPEDRKTPRSTYPCDATFSKGEEMGWFEHGSTILVFAPKGFSFCEGIKLGAKIRVGQALMKVPK